MYVLVVIITILFLFLFYAIFCVVEFIFLQRMLVFVVDGIQLDVAVADADSGPDEISDAATEPVTTTTQRKWMKKESSTTVQLFTLKSGAAKGTHQ